jgi:hypothetical protein
VSNARVELNAWAHSLCKSAELLVNSQLYRYVKQDYVPRKIRNERDKNCYDRSPVVSADVGVPRTPSIQAGHIDRSFLDEPVVTGQN